ncbi:hypothetical protein PCASD_07241 [Puccinia coronata f. sp. avenae]|uniref:Uncharacterized protein n=1 Tax=Puccinia coronata f. sp. avenae TaxID=200324 RepID=A0A2N5UYQ8_9BASI|nr:hypothetical protein PCASD_07241 [Puccinia coronata f. sp. avenae]
MNPAIHPNLHLVDLENLDGHCTDFHASLGIPLPDHSNLNSQDGQAQLGLASLSTNEDTNLLTTDQTNSAPAGSNDSTKKSGKKDPVTKRAKRGPYKKRKRNSSIGLNDNQEAGRAASTSSTTVPGIANSATRSVPGNTNSSTTPLVAQIANSTTPREGNGPQLAQAVLDADAHTIRTIQASTCKAKRITNHIKDELQKIMLEYQKQVHLLAIKNQIRSELIFRWLGVYNKSRTPNRFNNYCRYSPEARKVFSSKEFPPSERMQLVGEIWRDLSDEEQLKYNDWDYINKLRLQMGLEKLDNPEGLEPEDENESLDVNGDSTKSAPNNQANPTASGRLDTRMPLSGKANVEAERECEKWVNKAVRDFNYFSLAHRVEGFFLLSSTDLNGTVFKVGGSAYGNECMTLLTGSPTGDPWKAFRLWASGLTANQAWQSNGVTRSIKKSTVTPPADLPPWDLGNLRDNKSSMLDQLRRMLVKATQGRRSRGWPEHAEADFKALGLVLKVAKEAAPMRIEELLLKQATKTYHKDEVKYVLMALHNKWVSLVCKDAEDVVVEGAEEVV